MLKNIHVKSFALIDEVEINLASGLNVLTGETGAGKSIIIDAVNFALGQRVSKDVVRDDAEYALSELVFEINDDKTKERLNQFDIPLDDNEVLIQRKITNGKSTARINGETVTLSTLALISALLFNYSLMTTLNKSSDVHLIWKHIIIYILYRTPSPYFIFIFVNWVCTYVVFKYLFLPN